MMDHMASEIFDIDSMPRGGPDASCLDRRLQTDRLEYLALGSGHGGLSPALLAMHSTALGTVTPGRPQIVMASRLREPR
jgi:hypothetical protein